MTGYETRQEFRDAVLGAGLLIETGVDGLYQRSGTFEDIVVAVQAYAAAQRINPNAERRAFGPIMPVEAFLRTDYLRSFPDLVGAIRIFNGSDAHHRHLIGQLEEGADWSAVMSPAEVALSSSICHHVYGTLPHQIPDGGIWVEASGFAFRHEPSLDLARMQSFRMYEHIVISTPAEALAHRDAWCERAAESLRALGLEINVEPANDPFFGRVGRMLAANQREAALKYEFVCDITAAGGTAIGSSNYHLDHFGGPFDLVTSDGAVAHSSCVGYGLERTTLALLATHGLDPTAWPEPVRARLWG